MTVILHWNIRGLNKSNKRLLLKDMLWEHRVDVVGIQETKKKQLGIIRCE